LSGGRIGRVKVKMRALSLAHRSQEKSEKRHALLTEEVHAFFEQHLSSAVLEVFPDWQGILLACDELAESVWIVRTLEDGQQLHAATGQPALLLADLLTQKGRDFAEAWKALRPRLIFSRGEGLAKGEGTHEETARKRTKERG
jgi:hypothetical protein